ncbi:MAG: 1,4-alpha-glucan branching protein GlgB [Proteobacteria bacterium]|nr:1,4-alpha-glucan branching protein GlgB [Pseudomonadota bacterium]
MLSPGDLDGFAAGHHSRIYTFLGAQPQGDGTRFAVWAPNARNVWVKGDFDGWRPHAMSRDSGGVWVLACPTARPGQLYKYVVEGVDGVIAERQDPVGFAAEQPPGNASRIVRSSYSWRDARWLGRRKKRDAYSQPISIYELHAGSWRRHPDGRPLSYTELAEPLADHLLAHGFTHVEFLPLMEHPFYGSWGYQALGHFAPTSRFGDPDGLRALVDHLHGLGLGVILDWVPAHFPKDGHGLARFDGTALYEHADPRRGEHPDWKTAIFDYGRPEIRSFLLSSARYWLEEFHADGLRVDAVASMLYLDYSRTDWLPNEHGGRENLEAISLLRDLNEELHRDFPGALVIAEESTAWPGVSRPTFDGGLGFSMKWDMGWMNDTLQYLGRDPIHRCHHHNELTFRSVYAHSESFVLALSHDEVVHGKGSLMERAPGDDWQKRATSRLLFGWQFAQPGKKLLFMGMELGQRREWAHDGTLEWELLEDDDHAGLARCVTDLNKLYRDNPGLHRLDTHPDGVAWTGMDDSDQSVVTFVRQAPGCRPIVVVANFTPMPREDYRIGLPEAGHWRELLNTDASEYGGSGVVNTKWRKATPEPWQGLPHSTRLRVPPLGVVYLRPTARGGRA